MVLINIRLVGEQKDRTFNAIDLDNQILYVDLKKRIETVTKIPVDFQQIEFRGEELPVVERPMQTIQFGEELVVKHADLPWWVEYKECVELVLKQCSDKVEIAKTAVEHHERLMESGFFKVYAEFANFRRQKHYKVAAWTDGDVLSKNTRGQESHSEVTAVKRRRVDTPEIYPAGETHPEHIDRIKHLLFQALDDNDQDAIVTVIDSTHAVASFHCFESYVDSNKSLIIRNVLNPAKVFTLHAVKSCRASVCQVVLFESEVRLIAEDERVPQINLPLWGRQYYVLGNGVNNYQYVILPTP